MRRIVARFADADSANAAREALLEADLDPGEPGAENPFFDPTIRLPEATGLLWGSLFGAIIGAIVLVAMELDVLLVPRLSPIMTAGPLSLVFLGIGLGMAAGGFIGGSIGTYRTPPEPSGQSLSVMVSESRVSEIESLLRGHGATAVADTVTIHEHPHRNEILDS